MLSDIQDAWNKYPAALPMDTILAGKYMIKNVLGQGGFGITYLAEDYRTKEKVAVKEYFPETMAMRGSASLEIRTYTDERSDNFRFGMERFLEEAKVLAQFQGNKHIVGVRQYFEENATAYFVMDYIEGIDFKTYIKEKGGKLPWEDVQRIMLPIMEALDTVHKKGLVHRDVTPDNIIIANDGTVKLLDFGAARYSLGDHSRSLDVVLKPGYAPKEQYVRRGKQGPYTDVYSVAACFYAALSGYLPPESLERMEEDNLVPLSTRGVHLPEKAESAILKGLEVRAEDRFQSMEEFRLAIDGETPEPKPEPKPKKKSFIMIGAAACTMFCIISGIFFGREIGMLLGKKFSQKQDVTVSEQYNNNLEYDIKTNNENNKNEYHTTANSNYYRETENGLQSETKHKEAAYFNNILMADEIVYTPEFIAGLGIRREPDKWVLGKEGLARRTITSITFVNTLQYMPEDAWDVSQEKNGLVMAWVEPLGDGQIILGNGRTMDLYHLYIAAEGGIQAASGKTLFACYRNLTKINFNNCFYTDQVTDMSYMFGGCSSLTNLNLSDLDTSKVMDMSCMFDGCSNLTYLDLNGFNTEKVETMENMFSDCKNLITLNINSFDTHRVKNMSYMFDGDESLVNLDLKNFDTGRVTDMSNMFDYCLSLKSLDLSNFDTSYVTNMRNMFDYCSNLESLDLSNFNTSHVTDMFSMFGWCSNLTYLNINSFNTDNVTNMSCMFSNCENLTSLDLSSFNTEKADNAGNVSNMFEGAGINANNTGIKFSNGFYYFQ